MKNNRFAHIFSIMILALIFAFGMAISVMADDTDTEDASTDVAAAESTVEEAAPADTEDPAIEEAAEEVVNTGDTDISDDNEVADDTEDEDFVSDDTDDEEEEAEEVVEVVVPEDDDVIEGVGDASWAEPVEGGMMYYVQHPDGTIEATFVPDEENFEELGPVSWAEPADDGIRHYVEHSDGSIESWFEPYEFGVVGDASSYDPTTGKTTVYGADGSVRVYYDNDSSYRTASAVYSDTFSVLPVAEKEKEETVEVKTAAIAPVAEAEESAVLGDYEDPESERVPFTAGIAFFTSTLVGLGVLWKLGILTL